jgi:hypothetical protein
VLTNLIQVNITIGKIQLEHLKIRILFALCY